MKQMKPVACIIDDDQVYLFGVKKMILFYDFCKDVLTFRNGEEALKYLLPRIKNQDSLPGIIMLDINMPVMDGWEFLDAFVKMKTGLPGKIIIYVVSSSIQEKDIERVKAYADVEDYIIKPVNFESLKQILGNSGPLAE